MKFGVAFQTTTRLIGLAIFPALLAACGSGSNTPPVPSSATQPLFGFSPLQYPGLAPALGNWQTGCMRGNVERPDGSTATRIQINGSQMLQDITEFDDPVCSNPDLDIISTYMIAGADPYSPRQGDSDLHLDLRLISTVMTPATGYARVLNEAQLCSQGSWVDGQPRHVEQASCSGYVTLPIGSELHDYVELSGSSLSFMSQRFSRTN